MVAITMKYVTRRLNKDGTVRWYWQRPGHPVIRLPDDENARAIKVFQLNAAAMKGKEAAPAYGTVGWAVADYRASPRFAKLARGTQKAYMRWLDELGRKWKHDKVSEITVKDVDLVLAGYPSRATRNHIVAVLLNVFRASVRQGLITVNPAASAGLEAQTRRDVVWQAEQIRLWLGAALRHPEAEAMRLCFALLLYTIQRPGDILEDESPAMQWTQYDGSQLSLRQQKTGRLVKVPCHKVLKPILDAAKAKAVAATVQPTHRAIVTTRVGKPMTYNQWQKWFREVCAMAGLTGLQARDLRRTGCVHMAEAGCPTRWIAAVSGHSERSITDIIETYAPATTEMARRAIDLWESNAVS